MLNQYQDFKSLDKSLCLFSRKNEKTQGRKLKSRKLKGLY